MKKLILLTTLLGLGGAHVIAQTPFPTISYLDINKVKASVLVHGDMWWDPVSQLSKCFYPSSTTKNIGFAAALWMSGYDASSQLHVASQMYRQNGNDYWPGPLDASGSLSYATSTDWAKIWKVNRNQISAFIDSPTHTTANTPVSILTWPGKGNTYATGNAGVPLTITNNMAPFVDINSNGIYEPLLGDYPDVKGDQALWWVVSDNGPLHDESNGVPLGVEIHNMAYGYNRGTLIDNVLFYEYTITNKSPNDYTDFRIGQFADMDLGSAYDDYVGFDSVHRMGITYNGDPSDSVYASNMPIAGVTMIILPGDAGTTYVPAGSFMYFKNDTGVIGNPLYDVDYNNYLRSLTLDGQHVSNDFTTAVIPTIGYGSGPNTNYVYPGDPGNLSQWSECSSGNISGDRRFVIASNDFTLAAGATQKVVMALVTSTLSTGNACGAPGISFAGIKTVADTAWNVFFNPLPPSGTANVAAAANTINIFPNPAHDQLRIENTDQSAGDEYITIYNAIGQVVNVTITKIQNAHIANINNLPAGLYNVLYRKGDMHKAVTFVKE